MQQSTIKFLDNTLTTTAALINISMLSLYYLNPFIAPKNNKNFQQKFDDLIIFSALALNILIPMVIISIPVNTFHTYRTFSKKSSDLTKGICIASTIIGTFVTYKFAKFILVN